MRFDLSLTVQVQFTRRGAASQVPPGILSKLENSVSDLAQLAGKSPLSYQDLGFHLQVARYHLEQALGEELEADGDQVNRLQVLQLRSAEMSNVIWEDGTI